MAKIPAEVQEVFKNAPYCVYLTASADAQPNGNVIMMKSLLDDETIYLSDQFFNKSLKNMAENDKVAVVFSDGQTCAYEVYGTPEYVTEGEIFESQSEWVCALFEQMGMPVKPKGGCIVHVNAVFNQGSGPTAGAQIA